MTVRCPICRQHFQEAACESHHIYPVAYGGSVEGHQITLCGGCHALTHQQAESYARGSAELVMSPEMVQRARFLIKVIMVAKQNYKEGVVHDGDKDAKRHKIITAVDKTTLALLKQAAKIHGFKSVRALMDALIQGAINRASIGS